MRPATKSNRETTRTRYDSVLASHGCSASDLRARQLSASTTARQPTLAITYLACQLDEQLGTLRGRPTRRDVQRHRQWRVEQYAHKVRRPSGPLLRYDTDRFTSGDRRRPDDPIARSPCASFAGVVTSSTEHRPKPRDICAARRFTRQQHPLFRKSGRGIASASHRRGTSTTAASNGSSLDAASGSHSGQQPTGSEGRQRPQDHLRPTSAAAPGRCPRRGESRTRPRGRSPPTRAVQPPPSRPD